jgi:peptidoglycan/xylan/chitin deacetylase (PgdA/CDA1 family)
MIDYFENLINPFIINIEDKQEYTYEDYINIQNKLKEKNIDGFLKQLYAEDMTTTFEEMKRRITKGIKQEIIDLSNNILPTKQIYKIGKGGENCFVCCTPLFNDRCDKSQNIIESFEKNNFDGYFILLNGGFPNPTGKEMKYCGIPYSFKIFMMLEAVKLGFEKIIWIDAACYCVNNPKRLFDLLDELKIPASILLNSAVCYEYPEIIEKIKQRGDDVLGHGRTNAELLKGMWEDDERSVIMECVDVIQKYVGVRPYGWMGAGSVESSVTPDLLKECGFTHTLDWPVDDQPIYMRTRAGSLLSVPYPMELNDAGTLILRDHSGKEFADMIVDQFEYLLEASEKQPLVFSLSLHGYIVGQPFRLRPLIQAIKHCVHHPKADEIWFTRAGDISKYCMELEKGIIPGSEY